MSSIKVYISNLASDAEYKKELLNLNKKSNFFTIINNYSDISKISQSTNDDKIIKIIQEKSMNQADVFIFLVGNKLINKGEYTVDWEIAAAMKKSSDNKQKGILIIVLPNTRGAQRVNSSESEKILFKDWSKIEDAEKRWNRVSYTYPTMPSRLIDNIILDLVNIDVINWDLIIDDPSKFKQILKQAVVYAKDNKYNTVRPLIHRTLIR